MPTRNSGFVDVSCVAGTPPTSFAVTCVLRNPNGDTLQTKVYNLTGIAGPNTTVRADRAFKEAVRRLTTEVPAEHIFLNIIEGVPFKHYSFIREEDESVGLIAV